MSSGSSTSTGTELVRTRAHLTLNRELILRHAIASAVAGLAPLPYLDDLLPSLVRRRMLRRIAESRGVDVDEEALIILADGTVAPPGWRNLVGATPVLGFLRRSLRTALAAVSIYRRAESAGRTFALATLFDHYCARQHVGGALGPAEARALRGRMERAVTGATGSVPAWLARQVFARALKRAVRAPRELMGVLRQRRLPAGEIEAEEIVERSLVERDGTIRQAVRAVDEQAATSYVDQVVDAFERQP